MRNLYKIFGLFGLIFLLIGIVACNPKKNDNTENTGNTSTTTTGTSTTESTTSTGITTTESTTTTTNNEDTHYTVVFHNTNLPNLTVKKGEKVLRPEALVKDGYIFDDWYDDENFNTLFDFEQVIEDDTTIYASFYLTLAKAKDIASALSHNTVTNEKYYIKGKIKSIDNIQYGNMTITDGEHDFYVYGVSRDGSLKYEELEQKPVVGDTIYIYGVFKRYNDSLEMNNSWLIKMVKNEIPDVDVSDYQSQSIAEARNKGVDSKVLIEGVVSQITYANGMKANGLFLVDNTGAMYVFDSEIASSVSIGDTIKVAGSRANFILESEKDFANKHGYQGAIQITETILVSKTEGNADFNKSWIEEKTIRQLLKTDHTTENITGNIYKVNTFIRKAPGTGFTNYYFDDLDQNTGSYTYTMNNGNDFEWLDQYDGQLRTVYLAVINAKASDSGILYRFVPIKVGPEYQYNNSYTPEFVIEYYVVDQFEEDYIHSPNKELITTVSRESLDFSNASISYSSNNTDSVYFETVDGKVILKTNNPGIAGITITATYEDYTSTRKLTITVSPDIDVDYISVAEAINQDDDTVVVVEGIVGASLVNQTGFYLIDDTGVIAVLTSNDELDKLNLGEKVIITGTKTHKSKFNDNGVMTAVGQIYIKDGTIVVNKHGNYEYSTSSFKDGKELKDFIGLNLLEDHSTDVYVFEAKIKYEATNYYTRYTLVDDEGNYMNIYSSSGSQLSFLSEFADMKVTVEFTVVNWNGKAYSGSVLSIISNGTKVVNDSNFKD